MTGRAGKALLLRVGMDRGTGGALGPIFPDGTFEYVPIPERARTRDCRSYAKLPGRHGAPLATYLPARLANAHPHLDPDFQTATYGDAAPRKRRQLGKLMPGDLLVFYSGLMPHPPNDTPRLFAIGYLHVKAVHILTAGDIKTFQGRRNRFRSTAHFLRNPPDRELTLVEGDRNRSCFFKRALPLGDGGDNLLSDLFQLDYQGSIRRAVGHWVRGEAAIAFLQGWLKHGPPILADRHSRLFVLDASLVRLAVKKAGDVEVLVEDDTPKPGDWVLILSDRKTARILLFGRINRCTQIGGRARAFFSLFWYFAHGGPCARNVLPSLRAMRMGYRNPARPESLRRLVSWFTGRYRIGCL